MSLLNKTARKASSDPVQEKLRQEKASWNSSTSELIAGLIALKRGLNGRGDPRAGLPPSSIKEPIPGEVVSYLHEVASRYEKVMSGATAVVRDQADYSEHRQKSQHEHSSVPTTAHASLEDYSELLTVTASNPLTRMWARVKPAEKVRQKVDPNSNILTKIWNRIKPGDEVYKEVNPIRIRLLKDSTSLVRHIREVKGELLKQDPESIPNTVSHLAELTEWYLGVFLVNYHHLVQASLRVKIPKAPKSKPKMPEAYRQAPVDSEEEEEEAGVEQEKTPEGVKNKVLYDQYLFFKAEQIHAAVVVQYLVENKEIKQPSKEAAQNLLQFLKHQIPFLYILALDQGENVAKYMAEAVSVEALLASIQQTYDRLLKLSGRETRIQANSFRELSEKLSRIKVSSYVSLLQEQDLLLKMANNVVDRWVRHNLLKVAPNDQQRLLLDILAVMDTVLVTLNQVMNLLEEESLNLSQLDVLILLLTGTILKMVERVILAANMYRAMAERHKGPEYIMSLREKIRRLGLLYRALEGQQQPLKLISEPTPAPERGLEDSFEQQGAA